MTYTREQYEADIKTAKAEAWAEGVKIATDHTLLKQVGVNVDSLHNPYGRGIK